MRHILSLFIVVSLLSQSAFSGGNSGGFYGNVKNILALGFAAFMGRGDQQLFEAVRIRHQAVMQAAPAERQGALNLLALAHGRYLEFVTNHGGNMAAPNPTQVNTWLTEAQAHVEAVPTPVAEETPRRSEGDRKRPREDEDEVAPRRSGSLSLQSRTDQFLAARDLSERRIAISAIRGYLTDVEIFIEEYKGERNRIKFRATTNSEDPSVLAIVNRLNEVFQQK